mmetsp:Transcript_69741/g.160284  ORF Transcript_69741/g.160284 Transcript_69741/m.160284 type:complete len:80 (+) Transcript_69741:127-366(+)
MAVASCFSPGGQYQQSAKATQSGEVIKGQQQGRSGSGAQQGEVEMEPSRVRWQWSPAECDGSEAQQSAVAVKPSRVRWQ